MLPKFNPDYTPTQLKDLGVYDEVYGGGKQLASMDQWPAHWLHPQDPKGWLQWYECYAAGRRSEDDERQIGRWNSFKARHGAQMSKNPTPRRGYALQHWAIDPAKLVEDKDKLMEAMDKYKKADITPVMQHGWHLIESELPSEQEKPKQPAPAILAKVKDMKHHAALVKAALKTERKQYTETAQVTRQPSAVIIQGNQDYIRGNHHAKKFYQDIAAIIRDRGYSVTQTKGEVSGNPPIADLWFTHGGVNPPKGTKLITTPQYRTPFITNELRKNLLRVIKEK